MKNNLAVQELSKNLTNGLISKGIPFTPNVIEVFSKTVLGSVENVTNVLDKSDERKHVETLNKIENDFKKTEAYMNLAKHGTNFAESLVMECLSIYKTSLSNSKELLDSLSGIYGNLGENEGIRTKAIEESVNLQKHQLDSDNKLATTLTDGTVKTVAIAGGAYIAKIAVEKAAEFGMEYLKGKNKSLVQKLFGLK